MIPQSRDQNHVVAVTVDRVYALVGRQCDSSLLHFFPLPRFSPLKYLSLLDGLGSGALSRYWVISQCP